MGTRGKCAFALLVTLMLLFVPFFSAHAVEPTTSPCYQDSCDNFLPNALSSNGIKCTSNITLYKYDYMYNHSGRGVGEWLEYQSNNCSSFWITFQQIVNNSQNVEIRSAEITNFRNTNDDYHSWTYNRSGPFPINTFEDGVMLGQDGGDCYAPYIRWVDYAGVTVDTYTNLQCP